MIENKTVKVNLNTSNTNSNIILSAEGLKNPIHMMIDTGAGSNLIKQQAVKTNVKINKYECLKLTGINEHPVFTLGQITIDIFGYMHTLNIIPNEVPIEHDGILGTEFFRNNNAKINYAEKKLEINNEIYPFEMQETILVPARTISDFYARIKNSKQKQGFIPQLHLCNGVYLGNAIVSNNNNKEENQHVENLIEKYADRFHIPEEPLGATNVLQHNIPTTVDQPIFSKQYRFPPVHEEEISRQVNELIENKIIKPSQSPYNTPVWIVPKKLDSHGNRKWRMILDFRKLNEKTIGDSYPLPNIIDILDQLGSEQYFSVFDLASGFYEIKMSPEDSHKTAFSTPYGHYEFDRMPFGL